MPSATTPLSRTVRRRCPSPGSPHAVHITSRIMCRSSPSVADAFPRRVYELPGYRKLRSPPSGRSPALFTDLPRGSLLGNSELILVGKVIASHLVAARMGDDERHARALPALTRAFQGMGIVAPHLPQVRAGGPIEDVEGVTFGEHLGPVAIDGDSVVCAHVVAELVRIQICGPSPHEVIGGHVAGRAARERGEVGVDFVGEIASAPLPIFRIDRIVYLIYHEDDFRPIEEMLVRNIGALVQDPL